MADIYDFCRADKQRLQSELIMQIQKFTFNAFEENTYILFDDTKQCAIVDPGCNDSYEKRELSNFISANQLKPVLLLNTHCHIDHMLGNKYEIGRAHV